MNGLTLEIQDDVLTALRLPTPEAPGRLRQELAVRLYQKGLLPFGKARALAGLTKWDFHELLGTEGIVRRYDFEELQEDLRALDRLA